MRGALIMKESRTRRHGDVCWQHWCKYGFIFYCFLKIGPLCHHMAKWIKVKIVLEDFCKCKHCYCCVTATLTWVIKVTPPLTTQTEAKQSRDWQPHPVAGGELKMRPIYTLRQESLLHQSQALNSPPQRRRLSFDRLQNIWSPTSLSPTREGGGDAWWSPFFDLKPPSDSVGPKDAQLPGVLKE